MNQKIVLLSLLIRFLVMPFFYHPDVKTQNFHFQFLGQGIVDIYQYLANHKYSLPYQDTFNYLPLTYFTFGLNQLLLKPLLPPDFVSWINDWGPTQNEYPNLPIFLFILKVPYLLCDFLIAYLLFRLYRPKIAYLWLLNPFTLYLIYFQGNFDVFPALLTLFALYLVQKEHPSWGFLVLGFSVSIKLYPLMFLPFFFPRPYRLKNIATNLFFLSLVPVISLLPFINHSSFSSSFLGSGLSQKILETKLFSLPLFPALYTLIFFLFLRYRWSIEHSILLVFFAFITLVGFHPQWLIWFLPLLAANFSNQKTIILASIILTLCLCYVFLFNDSYLFWGHLVPINPEFSKVITPFSLIHDHFHFDPRLIQIGLKFLIASFSFYYIFSFREKNS